MAPPRGGVFYCVYVLKSRLDKKFYIGFTHDLKARINRHKKGLVPSTKTRLPIKLIFYEAFGSKFDALRREKIFKIVKRKANSQKNVEGIFVPVAQLDRALACGAKGQRFESSQGRHRYLREFFFCFKLA